MGGCCGWVVCSVGCAPLNGRVLPLGSCGEGSSVFVLLHLVCEGTTFFFNRPESKEEPFCMLYMEHLVLDFMLGCVLVGVLSFG